MKTRCGPRGLGKGPSWLSAVALGGALLASSSAGGAEEAARAEEKCFMLHPIGRVQKTDDRTLLVLDKKYQPGLLGLDGFSHIFVFWWFDQNDTPQRRAILQVHPRGNRESPLTGVFATRSPVRPNLIALTLSKLVSVKDNTIEIESIDAFDGTPILDIKPYTPGNDSASGATVPDWARRGGEQRPSP